MTLFSFLLSFQSLFYDPVSVLGLLLMIQSGLVLAQHLSLAWSNQWYQLISEAILLFSNYYALFKIVRDYIVFWRISTPNVNPEKEKDNWFFLYLLHEENISTIYTHILQSLKFLLAITACKIRSKIIITNGHLLIFLHRRFDFFVDKYMHKITSVGQTKWKNKKNIS